MGTYSGELCMSVVFLAFDITSVSFICSEANVKHLIQNYLKNSFKMVDQKFVCVTFIILIVGSCVNSLPQYAATAMIQKSNNSSNKSPLPQSLIPLPNVIVVPDNCPEGQKMAIDGVCREVF